MSVAAAAVDDGFDDSLCGQGFDLDAASKSNTYFCKIFRLWQLTRTTCILLKWNAEAFINVVQTYTSNGHIRNMVLRSMLKKIQVQQIIHALYSKSRDKVLFENIPAHIFVEFIWRSCYKNVRNFRTIASIYTSNIDTEKKILLC